MPNLNNKTPLVVMLVPLIDRDGRNVAVVIAKATFDIEPEGHLRLSQQQEPIRFVDDPVGPEARVPADLTDFKPATDIVIVAPRAAEARRALHGRTIGVRVGALQVVKKVRDPWPFGPLPRHEEPRRSWAGTYNEAWVKHRMPLLPLDFDPRYFLAAPADQRIAAYLRGDEQVAVAKLYDFGDARFSLPARAVVVSGNVLQRQFTAVAALDTMLLWAEAPRLTLVWRHVIRPRQKIEEVSNVHVNLARLKNVRELYAIP